MRNVLRAALAIALVFCAQLPAFATASYTLVTGDTFTRTNTIAMFGKNTVSLSNGWIDPTGGTLMKIVSNQVVATSGNILKLNGYRKYSEWTRDGAVVVYQPGYTQSGSNYAGFGGILAMRGELSADLDGYYAIWQTSGTTGILQIFRCVAGVSTSIAQFTPTTGPATTNGFVLLATKNTTTVGQNIITVSLFLGSGALINTYSGNPNSPGTPYATLSYTDTTPGLYDQGAGGFGFTMQGTATGGAISQVQTYSSTNALLATTSSPLVVNSTATINLTGVGTSWTTTNPTFTAAMETGAASAGFSIASQNITSNTTATLTVNTGAGVGTLVIGDPSTSGSTYGLYVARPYFRIAAVSDSYAYQPYGASPINYSGSQSPFWIEKALNVTPGFNRDVVVNATGVAGATTSQWTSGGTAFNQNMPSIVQDNPDLIYLELGTNDATGGTAAATWQTSYQSIITYLKANTTSMIVLCPVIPRFDSSAATAMGVIPSYNALLPSMADGTRVFYDAATATNAFNQFSGRRELYNGDGSPPTGLHPGDLGMVEYGMVIAQEINAIVNPTASSGILGPRFLGGP